MRPSMSLAAAASSASGSTSAAASTSIVPAIRPKRSVPRLLRGSISSKPGPGGPVGSYVLPCRKLVVEYCPHGASSEGTRNFLVGRDRRIAELAREFPSVEVVLRESPRKHPLARGFYMNGRTKEIPLQNLAPSSVSNKLELILGSSGKKIVSLKRRPVESVTEAARGIWSALHAPRKRL